MHETVLTESEYADSEMRSRVEQASPPEQTDLKTAICDALAAFIRQRPGLARDKRDAETLLQAVRGRDSITGENLIEAAKHAFRGRLMIEMENWQKRWFD